MIFMITEDYCSPEVAKLLDKKGFREYCEAIYFILENGDYRWSKIDIPIRDCSTCKSAAILCPTHQMAIKWLRCKGIYIEIDILGKTNIKYGFTILKLNEGEIYSDDKIYTTFEETVEAALHFVLKNLI